MFSSPSTRGHRRTVDRSAARPGRVDQAVEIALPDAACRARLVDLYAEEIPISAAQRDDLVDRLDGVSAAFVKELMRRASVLAAIAGRVANHDDLVAALDELYGDAGALTRTLLGAEIASPTSRTPSAGNHSLASVVNVRHSPFQPRCGDSSTTSPAYRPGYR
jgi:hypothetical protein